MEVKPRYKQTDIGVIPGDWNLAPLGKLIHSVEYGSSAKSSVIGNIPVLRMGNLQGGKIDWNDLVFTDDDAEIAKYTLNPGDVLFNRTNTIDLVGKTSIYKGERLAIFAGYLIRIKTNKLLLDATFLNYVLNAEFSRNHNAKMLSVAVGQANINGQKLKTYPIPLPPTKAEQEAIAEALSDADGLIESLEQLLAKKRHVKQGAMQELLTAKRRLPGFTRQWASVCMRDVLLMNATYGVVTAGAFVPMGVKMLRSGDIVDGHANTDLPMLSSDKVVEYRRTTLLKNDVVIALVGYPGASAKIPDELIGANISRAVGLLRLKATISPDWLVSFLNSSDGRRMVLAPSGGSAQQVVNLAALNKLTFHVPEFSEQIAIGNILCAMGAEISALEDKLAKAQLIKQGMMQELLTGRIRLV